jgi:mannose-6-phosphate isomerase class I
MLIEGWTIPKSQVNRIELKIFFKKSKWYYFDKNEKSQWVDGLVVAKLTEFFYFFSIQINPNWMTESQITLFGKFKF